MRTLPTGCARPDPSSPSVETSRWRGLAASDSDEERTPAYGGVDGITGRGTWSSRPVEECRNRDGPFRGLADSINRSGLQSDRVKARLKERVEVENISRC